MQPSLLMYYHYIAFIALADSSIAASGDYSAFRTANNMPERLLTKKLTDDYSKSGRFGRPAFNVNESITIELDLALHSIAEVEDTEQPSVTIYCWMSQRWNDPMLAWEPGNYGGVEEINMPLENIWTPDTALYNGLYSDELPKQTAVIQSNGGVTWVLASFYKVFCERTEEADYPFDGIKCFYKFGSWTNSGRRIAYSLTSQERDFSMSTFNHHPVWRVTSHFANQNTVYYDCCPDTPYFDISFHLKLKRAKPLADLVAIFPFLVLGVLTAVPFIMPPNTVAKVQTASVTFFGILTYGTALFLSASKLTTSPKIVTLFQLELITSAVAIFLVSWFSELRHLTKPAPKCFAQLCHGLAVVVLCRCCSVRRQQRSASSDNSEATYVSSNNNNAECGQRQALTSATTSAVTNNNKTTAASGGQDQDCHRRARAIDTAIRDWRTIADVLNILTGIAFLVISIAIVIVNVPRPVENAVY